MVGEMVRCSAKACVLNRAAIPVIDAGPDGGRGVPGRGPAVVRGRVTATRPATFAGGTFGLPCILIIRRLEPGQRHDSAKLNELLRQDGVSA